MNIFFIQCQFDRLKSKQILVELSLFYLYYLDFFLGNFRRIIVQV